MAETSVNLPDVRVIICLNCQIKNPVSPTIETPTMRCGGCGKTFNADQHA